MENTPHTARRILVTGCSSGIGLAQADLFLKHGDTVYGIDKQDPIDLTHPNFHFFKVDLVTDLTTVFSRLPNTFDIICNTAGVLDDYKPLLEISDDAFNTIWQTNLGPVIKLTRQFLPQMIAQKSGIIINMCSIASFVAGGGGAAYTTAKHALAGFTRQLALDYARSGVQIFGIAPGAIQTAMTKKDFELDDGKMADWVANETPVGRWAAPSEVADLTFFLASGKASYMHGEILKIDGGWTLK
ncbi:3-oxoacyl-ACP reductase [Pseudolactococcus carnosus]|uniref:3-oxoacyl-ACP reductase n=1 Tax=Pseudolactococcus carnosus TaxID=2749961 RepID=A0ABT0AVB2_9LACT|nr:3-oxoacyl-ACP reductase [Lactococcus carnosus]SCA92849.1 Putative 3-oxoacyl-(acyl-carrier-protein) reductase (FabG) [Lactococcus piscium]MCJ1969165.1 3-oxoacyl-ACP reductase [Lactococcus carnosus]MCJ1973713.1 3-oxoacyl-ACP reductase [Lactococcus carnosus]MCJ1974929.1 3-oxoacyl-ACP reductase [Lactococcus carnosus]MCJ1985174.1 3-oxoacyl-ACP reductase [Lactococcus carnosus]